MTAAWRSMAVALVIAAGCVGSAEATSHRDAMRSFVIALAERARAERPGFLIVPQDGLELLTLDGSPDGVLAADYVSALDGVGQEDVSFGDPVDEAPTPERERSLLLAFLDRVVASGRAALVADYCRVPSHIAEALDVCAEHGFAGYAAPTRDLSVIAADSLQPYRRSESDVPSLASARNALYLLNPGRFADRRAFVATVAATDYDIVIVDAWFDTDQPLERTDIEALQRKPDGGRRFALAYLSIGEAEDYRDDWDPAWAAQPPPWLGDENPSWPGNYTVQFWNPTWQAIVGARLDVVVRAGFDGVYLDKVDAYETFESSP